MNVFPLDNKTAVVTGACGKLGKTWVRALADEGACVVATDLPDTPNDDINKQILFYNGKVAYCGSVDIMEPGNIQRLNEFCKDTFGVADILVNNAGIDRPPAQGGGHYTIETYPREVFRNIIDVNTYGAFAMIQVFGAEMIKASKKGSIINIGSLYAGVSPDEKFYDHIEGFLKPPSYGMSKAALVNMTKYLAAHWGKYGIRVNTLSPGGVEGGQDPQFKEKFTSRVPLGRMAVPEDLTGPLVFLASDASSYVTGTELKVDGGFTAL